MGNIKNGKFVYKNEDSIKKMHEFYDKTLASLDVPYSEDYFDTLNQDLSEIIALLITSIKTAKSKIS